MFCNIYWPEGRDENRAIMNAIIRVRNKQFQKLLQSHSFKGVLASRLPQPLAQCSVVMMLGSLLCWNVR